MSFAFGEGSINNDILHREARPDFQIDKSSQTRKSKSTPIIKSNHENRLSDSGLSDFDLYLKLITIAIGIVKIAQMKSKS